MHLCLRIPEIRQHVFDQVAIGSDRRSTGYKRMACEVELYALALTCLEFSQPALACLWNRIRDLEPIVRCLGRDAWELHPINGSDQSLKFSRPLTPSDIATIKKYAGLVRGFDSAAVGYDITDPEVWRTLSRTFKDAHLFPNLQHLELYTEDIVKNITLFPTQSLQQTRDLASTWRLSKSLLHFSAGCPNLTSIYLRLYLDRGASERRAIAAVSNWRHLSLFRSNVVTYGLLLALSQHSSSLKNLEFGFYTQPKPEPPIMKDTLVFPSLEILHGRLGYNSKGTPFFDCLSPHSLLKNLDIIFHSGSPAHREEEWLHALQTFKKHCRSLETLDIEGRLGGIEGEFSLPGTSIFATIATNFSLLSYVKLMNPGGFDVSDEDIRKLTEALPLLQEFHLTYMRPKEPQITHRTTVACLLFFAQNCHLLSHLSLDFDARGDKLPQQPISSDIVRGVKLVHINVQTTPTDSPERITSILCTIFPNLERIDSYLEYVGKRDYRIMHHVAEYGMQWIKVRELLEEDKKRRLGRVVNSTIKTLKNN